MASRKVTEQRKWRCPSCNVLLEKGALGVVWLPGEELSKVHGTATCDKCGNSVLQTDVYGGKYDYVESQGTRTVVCPGCNANLKILEDYAETSVKCPGCGKNISLNSSSSGCMTIIVLLVGSSGVIASLVWMIAP